MTKYYVDKNFELNNLSTWKRYPVSVSNELVDKVIKKSRRKYNPKHVKYVLSLLFSEMAQDFKNDKVGGLWFFDDFGSFKVKVYDKIFCLNGKRQLKENCKTVRFAYAYKYKAGAYKILNKDNKAVIDYLIEKRRNRAVLMKIFGVRYETEDN